MENILNIKQQMEEQEKINFAIANNKLEMEKQKLIELTLRKQNYEKQARQLLQNNLNVQEIRSTRHAIDAMKSAIRTQMIAVHVEEKNVDIVRKRLGTVRMERKTHEKLKEYAFDEYKAEYAKEEEKEIDQTVTYNYSKTR